VRIVGYVLAIVEVRKMEMKRSGRKTLMAAVLAATAVATATNARADDVGRATNEAGMGLTMAVANLVYIPAKIGYAALGGLTGGLGYVFSGGNKEVAQRVWVSSIGGDYVLNRQQLKGEEQIHFAGTSDPDM
jgi:hypothetical protein